MTERIVEMLADFPLTADRAAALIEKFAERTKFKEHSKLELNFGPAQDELRLSRDEDWQVAIANHWGRLKMLVCHDFGQKPAPQLAIDLRTGLVRADVPVVAAEDPDLAVALGLTPVAHDLNRYRKTAVTYEAAGWDIGRFAATLKDIVESITGGSEPVLIEAYYTYEHKRQKNVERLRGFFDVDDLIESLTNFAETDSKAASLREIELSFEGPAEMTEDGPAGRALGIHVRASPAPVQVTFLSPLIPDALASIVAPVRQAVELGDNAVASRFAGSSTSTSDIKTEEKFWQKHLAIPILLVLAATLLSTTALQAVLTDWELVLVTPVEKGSEYFMSKPGPLMLQWHARSTDTLLRRRDFEVPARVEAVKDGQVVEQAAGRSEATITLSPGSYVVVIRAEQEIDPIRFIVKVADPEASRAKDD